MPLAAYLYLCLMLGFDQESYLINGWKQGIFISLVVQDDELQPRSLCSIDERLPHMHFRAGQMVSTKGQRRNGLRHKLYQKCKHQHQHFHRTMFRTGNGQLNGNKEMEQQVRPTLISNKVTFGLKQAKKRNLENTLFQHIVTLLAISYLLSFNFVHNLQSLLTWQLNLNKIIL